MPPRKRLRTSEVLDTIFNDSGSESDFESDESSIYTDNSDDENIPHPPQQIENCNQRQHGPRRVLQNLQTQENVRNVVTNDYGWETFGQEVLLEQNWLPPFRERQGVLIDVEDYEPVDFFRMYFPQEAIQHIADETNRYALQFFDSPFDLPPFSRFRDWTDTTVEEISAMLALQITMGICSKPTIPEYWNNFWLTKTEFPSIMSRNRYQLLQSFLHFSDNTDRMQRGAQGYDPLFKIRPLLDIVSPTYTQYFQPGKNLSVDESMIKFKGRIFFKQYMPAKPIKWGVKQFVLCDAKTGFALRHIIYTGKECFTRQADTPLSEQIVLDLMRGYENKGHVVVTDNYYSSPALFKKLEQKQIGACGTVNVNRKNMPEELKPKNLKLNKGDDPVFYKSDNLVACCWHDTKRVTFLSTVDTNTVMNKRIRSRNSEGGYRNISKPTLADNYNTNMSGVDLYDQMLGSYNFPHKAQKWYHPIFHSIRETALVNGYITYRESRIEGQKLLSPIEFRKSVVNGLLESFESKTVQKNNTPQGSECKRLKERHFIRQYDNKKYKPDCKVCAALVPRVRKQTTYFCPQCDIALCVVPCFELFHTCKDFKTARENYNS